jgi:branched-chain amino acid transport system ATP-binding protein
VLSNLTWVIGMTETEPLLELEDVIAGYGDIMILDEISMSVDSGEIVALIGSNGVGKSTTTRVISGLIPVESGEIRYQNEPINDLPPAEIVDRGIVQVPERRELFTGLNVKENLLLGARSEEAKKNQEESLEQVFDIFPKLRERTDQIAGTMSGGERQMLALARAFMSQPELIILDEPSMGLAPKIIEDVFDVIRQFHSEGITILIIEQNVTDTLKLADRGYVMDDGRIEIEGTGEELLDDEKVINRYLGF